MAQTSITKSKSERQLKTSSRIAIVVAVLAFAICLIFCIINGSYMFKGETVSLNWGNTEEAPVPQKGDHATFYARLVLGNYAETKHTINGFIPAGTEQHYIILLDDFSVLSVTAKNSSVLEQLDRMTEATWNYSDTGDTSYLTESIELTGSLKSMNSEIQGYYHTSLQKVGITEAEYTIYNLTLDVTNTRFSYFVTAGLIFLVVVICVLIILSNRKKMKELHNIQDIARQNAKDPALNPFLQNGSNDATPNPFSEEHTPDPTINLNPRDGSADPSVNPYLQNGSVDPSVNPYLQHNTETPYDQPYGGVPSRTDIPSVNDQNPPAPSYSDPADPSINMGGYYNPAADQTSMDGTTADTPYDRPDSDNYPEV